MVDEIIAGESIDGRPVVRVTPGTAEAARTVTSSSSARATESGPSVCCRRLKGAPVLTVGDATDFLALGGVVGFRARRQRVSGSTSMRRRRSASGLAISSRLLRVARACRPRDRSHDPAAARRLTMRGKLVAMVMVISAAVLMLCIASFVAWDYFQFREDARRELSTQARMVLENSTAAMSFQDVGAARETLETLRPNRHIRFACLYDATGTRFAEFRGSVGAPALPGTAARARPPFSAPIASISSSAWTSPAARVARCISRATSMR